MTDSDFNTPPWILDLVRQLDPHKRIGLDPCSNPGSMVNPRLSYDVECNGLIQTWRGLGLVFMNPPHSMSPNNIEPWIQKAFEEFVTAPLERDDLDAFVGLVPAKTDTAWFHDSVTKFAARCFLKGRPKFWHEGKETAGPGKFASMMIYHGPAVGLFYKVFGPYGWIA